LPCCVAVAVSDRIAFGWRAKEAPGTRRGPARADRRELAGRAIRENERRNTILCDVRSLTLSEVLEVVYISKRHGNPDATRISGCAGVVSGVVVYLLQ
jgi:hypothetical protein